LAALLQKRYATKKLRNEMLEGNGPLPKSILCFDELSMSGKVE
jgi:hypothetical protein